ncbi:prolipoprotein diacylglyceryl transferase [Christensenellaceae bacterium OttesenSCG-928-L17]|nr:prolipoprotein diacylglyceryl transferase [Christensenellaceae bacterium OttesenSCG-928-L17]
MKNPDRIAFHVFGWPIYWYGILIAAGIIIAMLLAMREAKRKELKDDTILDLCLILIPCGIIGARLYYVALEWETYAGNIASIFKIWEGGLAIYGGVIGGAIGAFIYSRVKKIRFLKLADTVAPGLVLAQAIGRWGNFFNQEAFGLPVTDTNLLWFPLTVRIDGLHEYVDAGKGLSYLAPNYCPYEFHLATFFYESAWCLLIFAFLWFILRKRAKHDGDLFVWYLLLYGFERMFVEGLRGDSLLLIKNPEIRISQLLSFLLFASMLIFLLVRHFKEKKTGEIIWPAPAFVPVEGMVELPAQEEVLERNEILRDAQELNDILADENAVHVAEVDAEMSENTEETAAPEMEPEPAEHEGVTNKEEDA